MYGGVFDRNPISWKIRVYYEAAEEICLLISNIEHFDCIGDQTSLISSFRPAEDEHNFFYLT